jgi:hypothetical protein
MPDDTVLRSELDRLGRGQRITLVQRLSGGSRIEDEACAYFYALTGIFTRGRAAGWLTRRFVPASGVPGFPADVPELLLPVDRPVVLHMALARMWQAHPDG